MKRLAAAFLLLLSGCTTVDALRVERVVCVGVCIYERRALETDGDWLLPPLR